MKNKKVKTAVPALDKTIKVLDIVSDNEPMSAAEITRRAEMPRSSAHTLLSALVEQKLLYRTPEQRYVLGGKIMHWVNGFLEQQSVVNIFQNELKNYPTLLSFSITLTYLDDYEVVCLSCRNGNSKLGFTFRLGLRLPAGFAATGKAILSTLDNSQVEEKFSNVSWYETLTPYSVRSCGELVDELNTTRIRGYSIDDRQIRDGMFCVGVPVFDHTKTATHGIAISIQKSEAEQGFVDFLGEQLADLGEAVSHSLGYRR